MAREWRHLGPRQACSGAESKSSGASKERGCRGIYETFAQAGKLRQAGLRGGPLSSIRRPPLKNCLLIYYPPTPLNFRGQTTHPEGPQRGPAKPLSPGGIDLTRWIAHPAKARRHPPRPPPCCVVAVGHRPTPGWFAPPSQSRPASPKSSCIAHLEPPHGDFVACPLLRRSAARFHGGEQAIQPDASPTQTSQRMQPTRLIALTIAARSPNCRTGLANRAHQVDAREPDDPCRRMPVGGRAGCPTSMEGACLLACPFRIASRHSGGTGPVACRSALRRPGGGPPGSTPAGCVGLLLEGCDCQTRPLSLPGEGQPIVETDRGLPFDEGVGLEVTLLQQGLTSKLASPTRDPYPASLVSSPLAYPAKPAPGAASHGLCAASLHQ